MESKILTAGAKALEVNLDNLRYGSFAEIGAGQEVVRWFFRVGGAAGTIAKSISAYDMKVSDDIYGKAPRYVCRERLEDMLELEYNLNLERLNEQRGDDTAFFAFADTVSARNYHGTNECHGWLGIRFQTSPHAAPSNIIIHVRMLDNENALQQEALGIIGVNLIYGAFYYSHNPDMLVKSLLDNLSTDRIEVDMVDLHGDAFLHVDNRVISLRLVQLGLSEAAMFSADGKVLQPSEHLRKKNILVERGRFRPVTHVNIDMLNAARKQFEAEDNSPPNETVSIMEITMHNLHSGDDGIDLEDFICRADVLEATGHTVMISNYPEYYRLATYLSRYTDRRIGLTMGAHSLVELFNDKYYVALNGGILEAFGRLFKHNVKLYIYPFKDAETGTLFKVDNLKVDDKQVHLYEYLKQGNLLEQITSFNEDYLRIFSPDVLHMITNNTTGWEAFVPEVVADKIKSQKLFGYSA
ncbi:TonB-dependent receptor [Methylophaga sp. OBS3]|uniref:TonB-dependent receptor n=1 Tax=Methylophaga sp. OBS3 TaxID=2991934 RepID=UPI00225A6B86|nr:TonB-dependent receptor [Methylophaga sp. OBS3]MCX4188987.1 TonB-dependent receptor [Methylophaga sp. OBS3]